MIGNDTMSGQKHITSQSTFSPHFFLSVEGIKRSNSRSHAPSTFYKMCKAVAEYKQHPSRTPNKKPSAVKSSEE